MQITDLEIARIYVSKEKTVRENTEVKHKFELTLNKFMQLAKETKTCEYSGFNLVQNDNLSFERKNPHIDYTDDNTILVDRNANRSKGRLDEFVKTKRILPEVKLQLLDNAKGYIVEEAKKAKPGTPASALFASLQNVKHTVRVDAPFQLAKIYKHGSLFSLRNGKEDIGMFVLITVKQMISIPHGRGQRQVEAELSSLLNLQTFETTSTDVCHKFATVIEVLEKV
jgi:hypothetical protein